MTAVTKKDVQHIVHSECQKMSEVLRKEFRSEIRQAKDELSDQLHQAQLLMEETNQAVKTMNETLQPKIDKAERIDPLTERVEKCEEHIDILNLAVKSHVTNKTLHSTRKTIRE